MAGDYLPPLGDGRRGGDEVSELISRAIQVVVLAAILLSFAGMYWATREGDVVAVERQAQLARHAMESSVEDLALQQETVAVWDELAQQAVKKKVDAEWLDGNAGGYLNELFGHDEVYIINGHDQAIYGMVSGKTVTPQSYDPLRPTLGKLVANLRGVQSHPQGPHDFLTGKKSAPKGRRSWRSYHDAHLIMVRGRPAAASAMEIIPATPGYVKPDGKWPVIVSVRYLDDDFLPSLAARQLIDSPRFSRTGATGPDERAIRLRTDWGTRMGYLIFKPELFGTSILGKLVPLAAIILAALALLAAMVGRRLKKSTDALAAAEAHAAHLAYHDSLTGLPNRNLMQARLGEWIEKHPRNTPGFAMAILDVDEFKLINDTLGHDAGDAVLLSFADRLRSAVGPNDVVARLGGDEFAILLHDVRSAEQVVELGGVLLALLREPCQYNDRSIPCRASIGAALLGPGDSVSSMMKHADLALYAAKAGGRGVCRLYNPTMAERLHERQEMLNLAEDLLENDQIVPFYQPKVHLSTGAVSGFEALLRCCRPGEDPQGPDAIAAAFEDSALAQRISDRMIERVLRDAAAWQAGGIAFGHVAINASAMELRRGDFAERLFTQIERTGVEPSMVQLEVTESVLLGRGSEHVERTFRRLADRGIKLALDDFGTGFASLSHLKQFPVQVIKIDRSFVRDLQIDPGDGAIVDALIGLGSAMNMDVVAEGIETRAQRDFLWALGCQYGQGYLFSSAVPAVRVAHLVNTPVDEKGRSGRAA